MFCSVVLNFHQTHTGTCDSGVLPLPCKMRRNCCWMTAYVDGLLVYIYYASDYLSEKTTPNITPSFLHSQGYTTVN